MKSGPAWLRLAISVCIAVSWRAAASAQSAPESRGAEAGAVEPARRREASGTALGTQPSAATTAGSSAPPSAASALPPNGSSTSPAAASALPPPAGSSASPPPESGLPPSGSSATPPPPAPALPPTGSSTSSSAPPASALPPPADSNPPPSAAAEAELPPTEPVQFRATAVASNPFSRVTVDEVPRNVQQLRGDALTNHDGVGLNAALNQRLGSATINDVQSNPLQPDFQYRGFTASPLLGTPQGLSVYQNGVRINEPFGDVLQWDLIPSFAIANATVVPGADPIYGLNSLGGALVLETKNGFRAPGVRIEGLAGMFSRYLTTAEYGHSWGPWALYTGASVFGEQGYRQHSNSSAQNVFVDLRNREPGREIGVSITGANTSLNGNGPAPSELLAQDRSAVYTWPDTTQNKLFQLAIDAKQKLDDNTSVIANGYVRHSVRNSLNGDEADFSQCSGDDGRALLCDEDGARLRDESGMAIATNELFNAVFNTSRTASDALGASVQLDARTPLANRANHFLAGASYDGSHSDFLQRVEVGRLTLDRTVQGGGLNLGDPEYRTALQVQNHALGVFASDLWRVAGPLGIQASARLNVLHTKLEDQGGDDLDGNHTFVRVNPSVGVLLDLTEGTTLFANYSESNRAPSAAELSCADPTQPCRVPNAFISDPPLDQVVSRSVELGVRTRVGERAQPWLEGSLALFGTRNQDDILFVSGSLVGTGYFRNAGNTQRLGLEAALATHTGPVEFYASYTLLRATFEENLELPGGANPFARGGDDDDAGRSLAVKKGSRIPGLPTHAIKAGVTVRATDKLTLGLSALGQSSQPFRGDEGNYLRNVSGFVVLSANATYQVFEPLQLYVRATNLLDTKYSTFGVIADPSETFPRFSTRRFLGPGAPLGVWVGAQVAVP